MAETQSNARLCADSGLPTSGVIHVRTRLTADFTVIANALAQRRGSAVTVGVATYILSLPDGAPVRCAGVVLVRQCPGEGNTVFITLSDETGVCNVVIWERTFRRFRKEAMGSRLLLAEGKVQKSPEGVIHLMADTLIDRSLDLKRLSGEAVPKHGSSHRHPRNVRVLTPSRDFH